MGGNGSVRSGGSGRHWQPGQQRCVFRWQAGVSWDKRGQKLGGQGGRRRGSGAATRGTEGVAGRAGDTEQPKVPGHSRRPLCSTPKAFLCLPLPSSAFLCLPLPACSSLTPLLPDFFGRGQGSDLSALPPHHSLRPQEPQHPARTVGRRCLLQQSRCSKVVACERAGWGVLRGAPSRELCMWIRQCRLCMRPQLGQIVVTRCIGSTVHAGMGPQR